MIPVAEQDAIDSGSSCGADHRISMPCGDDESRGFRVGTRNDSVLKEVKT